MFAGHFSEPRGGVIDAEENDQSNVLAGRGAQRRLAGIWQVGELGPTGDYVVEPLGLDPFGTLTVIQGDKR
jgi:hypothetical protein